MAMRAAFVHEDVVKVVLPIQLLNDLLGQKGELVALWAFVVTLLLQFLFAYFIDECATFVVSLELLYSFSDILASSVFEGAVEGKFQSGNGLNFKDRRASIRTRPLPKPGSRHAFKAE